MLANTTYRREQVEKDDQSASVVLSQPCAVFTLGGETESAVARGMSSAKGR